MKVMAILSYDGSRFSGFQKQNSGVKTVANLLYEALKSMQITTTINASGRTDTGVHATNQVIDFDLPTYWSDLVKLKYFINQKIAPYIKIKQLVAVSDDFHSRYCAKRRVYRYLISDCDLSVMQSSYILKTDSIDFPLMKQSIKLFEGSHDFSYFKKEHGGSNSSIREIYKADFYRYKNIYVFRFEANGYLRSQIRMMVSFLLDINSNKLSKSDLLEQLECKSRHSTNLSPPSGLYLSRIKY